MITLPKFITHRELANLLDIWSKTSSVVDGEVDIDCSRLIWVDPVGLCVLRFWLKSLEDRFVAVNLIGLNLDIEAYMRRMNLLDDAPNLRFEDRTAGYARKNLTDSLVELRNVTRSDETDASAARIARTIVAQIPDLSSTPDPAGMRPSEVERADSSVAYVFTELLDNALTHGRSQGYRHAHAKVAAQFVRKRKRLQIAIVDDGCGLLQSLRGHPRLQDQDSHIDAIKLALEPRVSCNRDLRYARDSVNQGVGLTVSTRLALATGGEFTIYSGDAAYTESPNGRSTSWRTAGWSGTCVAIEFCSERLTAVEVSEIVKALPGFRRVSELNFE